VCGRNVLNRRRTLVQRVLSKHIDLLGEANESTNLRKLNDNLTVHVFLTLNRSCRALKMRRGIKVDVLADLSEEGLLHAH